VERRGGIGPGGAPGRHLKMGMPESAGNRRLRLRSLGSTTGPAANQGFPCWQGRPLPGAGCRRVGTASATHDPVTQLAVLPGGCSPQRPSLPARQLRTAGGRAEGSRASSLGLESGASSFGIARAHLGGVGGRICLAEARARFAPASGQQRRSDSGNYLGKLQGLGGRSSRWSPAH